MSTTPTAHTYEPGDLLLFYGTDLAGQVIRYGTWRLVGYPVPSHMGIVCNVHQQCWEETREETEYGTRTGVRRLQHNGPMLIESTTLGVSPCAIRGSRIHGVQGQFITRRIESYHGRVERMRLAPIYRLSRDESETLSGILVDHLVGLPYERLERVVLSGTRVLKWLPLWATPRANRQFCSEMVAAVLMRMGRMNKANPETYNPGDVVRELLRTGVYQEPVVVSE